MNYQSVNRGDTSNKLAASGALPRQSSHNGSLIRQPTKFGPIHAQASQIQRPDKSKKMFMNQKQQSQQRNGQSSPIWNRRPNDDYYNNSKRKNASVSFLNNEDWNKNVVKKQPFILSQSSSNNGPQPHQTSTLAISKKKLESPPSRQSL